MQELLQHLDGSLVADANGFARRATSLRGQGSHGERPVADDELRDYGHRLRLLVVLAYLTDSGCPSDVVTALGRDLHRRIAEAR